MLSIKVSIVTKKLKNLDTQNCWDTFKSKLDEIIAKNVPFESNVKKAVKNAKKQFEKKLAKDAKKKF